MSFRMTKHAEHDVRSLGRHVATAGRLIEALRNARLQRGTIVLQDAPRDTRVQRFDSGWCAISATVDPTATVTIIAVVGDVGGAPDGPIWAAGVDPAPALVGLAKRRQQGRITPDALSTMGLFPPFADLLHWVEARTMHHLGVRTGEALLAATIVPPANPGAQCMLTVTPPRGLEIGHRPLRGKAPRLTDDRVLLQVIAITLAVQLVREVPGRATALRALGLDTRDPAFVTKSVRVQRAMSWLGSLVRAQHPGDRLPTKGLAKAVGSPSVDEVLEVLRKAGVVGEDADGYTFRADRGDRPRRGRPRKDASS